ncbi:Serine protease htra2, mitochondrial [Cichlidogyrus casuarinus]|uniref:Serine protease htra2, mitochondrial n=1 Tax=Cichlidogyrus casuarinus TaxID=1844966 RepID=A0ABD2PWS7_9PLAT
MKSCLAIRDGAGLLQRLRQSSGSGFIVDDQGHVITNAHVVGKNSRVKIRTADKKSYSARVLAIHYSYDLALLRIDAPASELQTIPFLPLAPIKDPSKVPVRPGEFVLAAGSPLELENSITMGVVSAVERDLGNKSGLKYIQTDAIITFGNSGGPLVNLYGQVVGVNTMIAGTGLGFSIPVNSIVDFYNDAKEAVKQQSRSPSPDTGEVRAFTDSGQLKKCKKYLGLVMSTVWYGMTPAVRVVSVMLDSPAYRSGLEPGDLILELNDRKVNRSQDIQDIIANNDTVTMLIVRKGEKLYIRNIHPEQID